jgi:hypothetical protein
MRGKSATVSSSARGAPARVLLLFFVSRRVLFEKQSHHKSRVAVSDIRRL